MTTQQTLEQTINELHFPEIDVHEKVMASILNQNSFKRKVTYKLPIVIVLSLMIIVGTGFASIQFIDLYNERGEKTFSLKPFDSENNKPFNSSSFDEYMNLIGEGEAIAVYTPENNESGKLVTMTKPVIYNEWESFVGMANTQYKLPSILQDYYSFQEGRISYNIALPNDLHETIETLETLLREDSVNSNNSISYKRIEVSDDILAISLRLLKDSDYYTLDFSDGGQFRALFTDSIFEGKNEKFRFNSSEGVLIYKDNETEAYWRSITESDSFLYQITTSNTTDNVKDDILQILADFVIQ